MISQYNIASNILYIYIWPKMQCNRKCNINIKKYNTQVDAIIKHVNRHNTGNIVEVNIM